MEWAAWAFGGVGGAAVLAVLGWVGKRLFHRWRAHEASGGSFRQHIQSGDNSTNVQAGRDVKRG